MPKFMYNEDGPRIFQDDEKVPAGYVDSPAKVGKKEKPKKSLDKKKDK